MTYLPVFILMLIGLTVGVVILVLSSFLGAGMAHPRKNLPFECGVPSLDLNEQRFSVRFYGVAILFLLFDIEGVFFFPWAIVYKKFLSLHPWIFWEMLLFMLVLGIGYWYLLKKGLLEWE